MRFSPSKGTCYPEDVDYGAFPSDLIEFDDALWQQYCSTPGATLVVRGGKVVLQPQSGGNGPPPNGGNGGNS